MPTRSTRRLCAGLRLLAGLAAVAATAWAVAGLLRMPPASGEAVLGPWRWLALGVVAALVRAAVPAPCARPARGLRRDRPPR